MDEYRFLVDEDLSPNVADALVEYGFDTTPVQGAIGKGADDRTVCRFAERKGFVVVTNDDDFLQKPLLGRVPVLFVNNEYQQKSFETVELVREVVGYVPDPDQLPVFLHLSNVTD